MVPRHMLATVSADFRISASFALRSLRLSSSGGTGGLPAPQLTSSDIEGLHFKVDGEPRDSAELQNVFPPAMFALVRALLGVIIPGKRHAIHLHEECVLAFAKSAATGATMASKRVHSDLPRQQGLPGSRNSYC